MKLVHTLPRDGYRALLRGLIIERDPTQTYAVHLQVAVRGRKQRAFVYNFGTLAGFGWPYHWLQLSWHSAANRPRGRLAALFGSMTWGTGTYLMDSTPPRSNQ